MSKYTLLLLFTFLSNTLLYSQSEKDDLKKIKSKFYLYNDIGIDSSIYYMNKLLETKEVEYKVFGYAAIEYLKTREKHKVDINFFKDSISKYLSQVPQVKDNYNILFDTHILIGNTHKRRGLLNSALENYIIAENYALLSNDIARTIKIKGNIALIYQGMNELKKAINKGKETLNLVEINKEELNNKYYGLKRKRIFNLAAIYSTLYNNNPTNNTFADSTLYYYNSVLNDKNYKLNPYYKGKAYYGLGITYSIKKDYNKASELFEKSLVFFKKANSDLYMYKGYYNSGYNYYLSKDYVKAKNNFLAAISLKKDTVLDDDYMNMHQHLSDIYSNEKNIDSAKYYLDSFLLIHDKLSSQKEKQRKKAYELGKENDFNKKIDSLTTKNIKRTYIYNGIVFILVIILITISYFVIKNKREKKEANKRLKELLSKKKSTNNAMITSKFLNINDSQNEQIIQGLLKIEETHYYLKEDFNLYNAAKKIGTNTTYLSKVVKEHKKMSFSEYTNELRINYIVDILTRDKKIRAYTTQAIGEIGGYKNAKSFTRIFKKYTGITPYQFIEKINKEL
ncbi:Helix-turn-helix domain-containing protein [Tenacibaculum sp. 190130A14a]|uniref:Helix-turn-helix domain-containing protein n=1 Tax=Tenacibaculum polynesiense TaxID=3137857 RepID=A0ABP1F0D3_9FLAO